MKRARAIVIAERAAGFSLKLLAALNVGFLALFLLVTLLAASKARAGETVACAGENLLVALERDDPALAAQIRAEAAKVENGDAILWRIEKLDVEPSFLFGTMHMSDPRVVNLGVAAQKAFDGASTIVIETTDILDQSKIMAAMAADPELMMFTDGATLSSLVPEADREAFAAGLESRGIPLASVEKMKPWMLLSMVTMPACELQRRAAGAPVLDMALATEATDAGKTVAGLESIADQLGAMASLPIDQPVQGLVEALKLGDLVEDVVETMTALYLEQEVATIRAFLRAMPQVSDSGIEQDYGSWEERMIVARNQIMAERAEPILAEGDAFVAVGALHLPGPDGLVALLRDRGYTLSAVR